MKHIIFALLLLGGFVSSTHGQGPVRASTTLQKLLLLNPYAVATGDVAVYEVVGPTATNSWGAPRVAYWTSSTALATNSVNVFASPYGGRWIFADKDSAWQDNRWTQGQVTNSWSLSAAGVFIINGTNIVQLINSKVTDVPNDTITYGRVDNGAGGTWVPIAIGTNAVAADATQVKLNSSAYFPVANFLDTSYFNWKSSGGAIRLEHVANSIDTTILAPSAISYLTSRNNHTGTQTADTISDFADAEWLLFKQQITAGSGLTATVSEPSRIVEISLTTKNIAASNITSGVIDVSKLGTGLLNSNGVLFGDGVFRQISTNGSPVIVSNSVSLAVNGSSYSSLNFVDVTSGYWTVAGGDVSFSVRPSWVYDTDWGIMQATNFISRTSNSTDHTLTFDLSSTGTPSSSNFYSGTKVWRQVTTNDIPGLPALLTSIATNMVAGSGGDVYQASNNVFTGLNTFTNETHFVDLWGNTKSVRIGEGVTQGVTNGGWSTSPVDAYSNDYSVGIGYRALTWRKSVAIGADVNAGYYSVGIGRFAQATKGGSVAIGNDAICAASYNDFTTDGGGDVAIGAGAFSTGTYTTTVGRNAAASGYGSVALGFAAQASNDYEIKLGVADPFVFTNYVHIPDRLLVDGAITFGGVTRTNWPSGGTGGTNIFNAGTLVNGNIVTNINDGGNVTFTIVGQVATPGVPSGATLSASLLSGNTKISGLPVDISTAGSYRFLMRDPADSGIKPMTAAYALGYLDAASSTHGHSSLTNLTVKGDLSVTTNLFVGGSNVLDLIASGTSVVLPPSSLYGRGADAGAGTAQGIALGGSFSMSGTNLIVKTNNYGDISVAALGTAWTINTNAVTLAKFQSLTDQRLLGRAAGSAGTAQQLTVSGGLLLTNTALTIPDGAISLAKLTNVSASKLLGRGTGVAGVPQEITIGTGLSLVGQTLSAVAASTKTVQAFAAAPVTVTTTNEVYIVDIADDFTGIPVDVTMPNPASISQGQTFTIMRAYNAAGNKALEVKDSVGTTLEAGNINTTGAGSVSKTWIYYGTRFYLLSQSTGS